MSADDDCGHDDSVHIRVRKEPQHRIRGNRQNKVGAVILILRLEHSILVDESRHHTLLGHGSGHLLGSKFNLEQ